VYQVGTNKGNIQIWSIGFLLITTSCLGCLRQPSSTRNWSAKRVNKWFCFYYFSEPMRTL